MKEKEREGERPSLLPPPSLHYTLQVQFSDCMTRATFSSFSPLLSLSPQFHSRAIIPFSAKELLTVHFPPSGKKAYFPLETERGGRKEGRKEGSEGCLNLRGIAFCIHKTRTTTRRRKGRGSNGKLFWTRR